jgi:hypothetical protein
VRKGGGLESRVVLAVVSLGYRIQKRRTFNFLILFILSWEQKFNWSLEFVNFDFKFYLENGTPAGGD